MYNGIGLQTARGSGTNGYVQKNLSHIKRKADRIDYTSEEQLKKLDSQFKQPNAEILLHEKKRQIEVKCLEMEELMEEQGYTEEEINDKLTRYRNLLTEKSQAAEPGVELDDNGRPIAKATHQLAEASNARNEALKKAFGISEYFKEGSSLDPDRKAKEKAAMELAQKKYDLVEQPLSEEEEPEKTKDKKKKKKKDHKRKKSESDSSAEEEEEEEVPKKKKHKFSKEHKKRKH